MTTNEVIQCCVPSKLNETIVCYRWVNRKDVEGKNIFSGGFLGLDNIGVFDRSKPLPGGGSLAQVSRGDGG